MNARMWLAIGVLAFVAGCGQAPTKEDTGPVFYPPLPQTPRIQFLTSITSPADLGGSDESMATFLLGGPETEQALVRPFSVTHTKGRIYVADAHTFQVKYIDLDQNKFGLIRDTKGGKLGAPFGVFITPDGYRWVADQRRERIMVYNPRDEFYRAYGKEGEFRPVDVVVRGNRIYVADVRDSEVEILKRDTGEVETVLGGGPSPKDGMFYDPTQLSLDPEGHLFVTDSLNFRVEMFEPDGRFIKQFGKVGDVPGTFARPKGSAVDREGHLYVADAAFENIQIFDVARAQVLLAFATFGSPRGGSYLPVDVDIDYENIDYFRRYADPRFEIQYLIYVVNQSGPHKLNVYGFGKWKGKGAQ